VVNPQQSVGTAWRLRDPTERRDFVDWSCTTAPSNSGSRTSWCRPTRTRGSTLRSAHLRDRTGALVLAIRRPDGRFLRTPRRGHHRGRHVPDQRRTAEQLEALSRSRPARPEGPTTAQARRVTTLARLAGWRHRDQRSSAAASSYSPGQQPPAPWGVGPKGLLGPAELEERRPWSQTLHRAWLARRRVVVSSRPIPGRCGRRALRAARLRDPAVVRVLRERLQFSSGQQLRRARWRAPSGARAQGCPPLGSDVSRKAERRTSRWPTAPLSSTAARPTHRPSLGPASSTDGAPTAGRLDPVAAARRRLAPTNSPAVGPTARVHAVIAPAGSARRGC